jgi:hypothetical protein
MLAANAAQKLPLPALAEPESDGNSLALETGGKFFDTETGGNPEASGAAATGAPAMTRAHKNSHNMLGFEKKAWRAR